MAANPKAGVLPDVPQQGGKQPEPAGNKQSLEYRKVHLPLATLSPQKQALLDYFV